MQFFYVKDFLYYQFLYDQNYDQTLQRGTSTWFMTIIKLLFFIYSIVYPHLFQDFMTKWDKS